MGDRSGFTPLRAAWSGRVDFSFSGEVSGLLCQHNLKLCHFYATRDFIINEVIVVDRGGCAHPRATDHNWGDRKSPRSSLAAKKVAKCTNFAMRSRYFWLIVS